MISLYCGCVVDASVGLKVVLSEPDSPCAHALFERSALDPRGCPLVVPDLFHVECANVLWKCVRRGVLTHGQAMNGLGLLAQLDLPTTQTAVIVGRAFEMALQYDVSVYDACYVALAERVGSTLVTADARLVARLAGAAQEVVLLSSLRTG